MIACALSTKKPVFVKTVDRIATVRTHFDLRVKTARKFGRFATPVRQNESGSAERETMMTQ